MARARNIKPGFFTNEELGEMPPSARLLFAGIWTLADREGRLEDRPKRIRAQIFPYDEDIDVNSLLDLLNGSFIHRYEIEGERFIAVVNWDKHQKPHHMELPSVIPAPKGASNRYNHKPINKAQRIRIMERDGRKCVACGSEDDPCIDHKHPVSKGGSSDDDNLQVLCAQCNGLKGNRDIDVIELRSRREQAEIKSSTGRDQVDGSASCPTDSLNLIPSSLIPDSGFSDSLNPINPFARTCASEGEQEPPQEFDKAARKKKFLDESHTEFYQGYWRHVGKEKSRKAWAGAIVKVTKARNISAIEASQFLIQQMLAQRREMEQRIDLDWLEKTHPASWLNGGRWDDEIPPPRFAEAEKHGNGSLWSKEL